MVCALLARTYQSKISTNTFFKELTVKSYNSLIRIYLIFLYLKNKSEVIQILCQVGTSFDVQYLVKKTLNI